MKKRFFNHCRTLKVLSCIILRLCELSFMWSSMKISDANLLSNHSYSQNTLRSSNTLDKIKMAAFQQSNSGKQCAWSVSTQLTIKYRLLSMKRNSTVRGLRSFTTVMNVLFLQNVPVQFVAWAKTESRLSTLPKDSKSFSGSSVWFYLNAKKSLFISFYSPRHCICWIF